MQKLTETSKKINIKELQSEAKYLLKEIDKSENATLKAIKKIENMKECINTPIAYQTRDTNSPYQAVTFIAVTPIFYAFYRKAKSKVIIRLIELGADLNTTAISKGSESNNISDILKAIILNDDSILLELFLEYVDDPNYTLIDNKVFLVSKYLKGKLPEKMSDNFNVLHQAIGYNADKCLAILLKRHDVKDLINALDSTYGTPLHFAASMKALDVSKMLVKSGSNPDIPHNGVTARDLFPRSNPEWQIFLPKKTINENIIVEETADRIMKLVVAADRTPIDYLALEHDLKIITEMLKTNISFCIQLMTIVIRLKDLNALKLLVKYEVNLDVKVEKLKEFAVIKQLNVLLNACFPRDLDLNVNFYINMALQKRFAEGLQFLLDILEPKLTYLDYLSCIKTLFQGNSDQLLLDILLDAKGFKGLAVEDLLAAIICSIQFKKIEYFDSLLRKHSAELLSNTDRVLYLYQYLFTKKELNSETRLLLLRKLLQWKLPTKWPNRFHENAALYAIVNNQLSCLKELMHVDGELLNVSGIDLVVLSAFYGSMDLFDFLVEQIFPEKLPEETCQRALEAAMYFNNQKLTLHIIKSYAVDMWEEYIFAKRTLFEFEAELKLMNQPKINTNSFIPTSDSNSIKCEKIESEPSDQSYNPFKYEPERPMSAFSYLVQNGYTPQEIKNLQKSTTPETENLAKVNSQFWKKPVFLWDKTFSTEHSQVRAFDNSDIAFLYLASDLLSADGCPPESLTKFSRRRLVFDDYHVRRLEGEHLVNVDIGGNKHCIKLTHELKIKGEERVLLFPLISDDKNAVLYIGCRYLSQGLHELRALKELHASTRTLKINFPSNIGQAVRQGKRDRGELAWRQSGINDESNLSSNIITRGDK